jgi:hypothetical protein
MAAATVVVQDDETIDSVDRRHKHSLFLVIIHYTDNTLSTLPETHFLIEQRNNSIQTTTKPLWLSFKSEKEGERKG